MPKMDSSRAARPFSSPEAVLNVVVGIPISLPRRGRSRALDRVADDDDAALGTGHGALDKQDALLLVGLHHKQVQGRDPLPAQAAGHAGALEDPGRRGARPDRTRGPM